MAEQTRRLGVFPGTFDPISKGHLDVIERGLGLFDELVVAVGNNPDKASLFTQQERAEMVSELLAGCDGVRVETYEGLTVDFARKVGAAAILRGLRNSSDVQFELQVAMTNRVVAGIETVFVMTSPQFAFTSSSLVKQIAARGGDVSALVPPIVVERLEAKRASLGTKDDHLDDEA